MKPDKDNIKDIFASKLRDFAPEPPRLMWEKIEADLSSRQVQNMPSGKKPLVYKLLPWAASAAAIIIAAIFLFPKESENTTIAEEIKVEHASTDKSNTPEIEVERKNDADIILKSAQSDRMPTASAKQTNIPTTNAKQATGSVENNNCAPVLPLTPIVEDNNNSYLANKGENPKHKSDVEFEKELAEKMAEFEAAGKTEVLLADNSGSTEKGKKQPSPQGLSLGVEGGGAFSKASEMKSQMRSVPLTYSVNNSSNQINSAFKKQRMKLDHNQPINFGITISKKINNRIFIESGVIYSYLSSKIKSTENPEYTLRDSQKFHYLGIPLSINYKLVELGKLQLYTSVGGIIQKDIYGELRSNEKVEDLLDLTEYTTRNISQKNPQFAVTGSLGLGYPLYNKLSVYSNLGGAYYLDAKNEYETIYSDRKWIFNINLGLRFGF